MWLGLFGAPIAWAGSHVVGWGVSEANCEIVGRQWGINFDAWETVLLVLAVVLALAGLISSALTYREVKGTDKDADPPAGRLWLLSIAGLVLSPLLLTVILLTHIGALALSQCHQG
jgi:heme/copper-type cytochrome/quinol oxidase subunit 2